MKYKIGKLIQNPELLDVLGNSLQCKNNVNLHMNDTLVINDYYSNYLKN